MRLFTQFVETTQGELGFPQLISALSDPGSIFILGNFSSLGFTPPMSALSDRGRIFIVGVFVDGTSSPDLACPIGGRCQIVNINRRSVARG